MGMFLISLLRFVTTRMKTNMGPLNLYLVREVMFGKRASLLRLCHRTISFITHTRTRWQWMQHRQTVNTGDGKRVSAPYNNTAVCAMTYTKVIQHQSVTRSNGWHMALALGAVGLILRTHYRARDSPWTKILDQVALASSQKIPTVDYENIPETNKPRRAEQTPTLEGTSISRPLRANATENRGPIPDRTRSPIPCLPVVDGATGKVVYTPMRVANAFLSKTRPTEKASKPMRARLEIALFLCFPHGRL